MSYTSGKANAIRDAIPASGSLTTWKRSPPP